MTLLDGIAHELDLAGRWLLNARVMAERGDRNGQVHAMKELAKHTANAEHVACTVVRCVEGGWKTETEEAK